VLGEMVAIEPGAVIGLDQLSPARSCFPVPDIALRFPIYIVCVRPAMADDRTGVTIIVDFDARSIKRSMLGDPSERGRGSDNRGGPPDASASGARAE
jgi:hypothetical protein